MSKTKIIFIHGNGGCTPYDNWIPWLKQELEDENIEIIARQFPDAKLARSEYWLPFLKDELGADENSILIGHSSGAIASLRFAEENKIRGTVLVAGYHTDLGMHSEKQSGYFDKPWDWQKIKDNQQWVLLFASTDDPWIPIKEPRFVQKKLNAQYHEFTDQGHFGGDYHKATFPELLTALKKKLNLH